MASSRPYLHDVYAACTQERRGIAPKNFVLTGISGCGQGNVFNTTCYGLLAFERNATGEGVSVCTHVLKLVFINQSL